MNKILVEVSIGELLDKMSILEIKKEKIKREILGSSKHGLRSYFGRNKDEGTFFINSQEKRFRIDNIRDSIRQIKQSYEITKNEAVKKNEEEQ